MMHAITKKRWRNLGLWALLPLLLTSANVSQAQMTGAEQRALADLKQALLTNATELPALSSPDIYEAQFALTIDQAIGGGTNSGSTAGVSDATASNQHCVMVLQAIGETLVVAPNENARTALLNLRANLLACRGGTGAGGVTSGILFELPQPQTGGGADYVQ